MPKKKVSAGQRMMTIGSLRTAFMIGMSCTMGATLGFLASGQWTNATSSGSVVIACCAMIVALDGRNTHRS